MAFSNSMEMTDRIKYPLLPLPNKIKNKMYSGIDNIIKYRNLDIPEDLIPVISENMPFIIRVFNDIYNKNDYEKSYTKLVNTIYDFAYLSLYNVSQPPKLNAIMSIYKNLIKNNFPKHIDEFKYLHGFLDNTLKSTINANNIKEICTNAKKELDKIRIITVANFLNETQLKNLFLGNISIMSNNILFYNDPEVFIKTVLNIDLYVPKTNSSNYTYSYEFPEKEDEYAFGGKKIKSKKNNKNKFKKNKTNRKKNKKIKKRKNKTNKK